MDGEKESAIGRWLLKMKIGKWQALVLAAGLLGILLLCLSALPGKTQTAAAGGAGTEIRVDLTAYEQQLERRLCETIAAVAGAGETRVMLTLDSGSEPIYATQGKTDQKNSVSGQTLEESLSDEKQYVTIGTGAGEHGLVLKMLEPQVRGVAVVCQGGDDLVVQQSIIAMVTAVLGVGANKVSVARMGQTNE